jgi:N,N'-diacetyllegionaminate synthase
VFNEFKNIFIIAEAGVNHNGDVNLAKKLIDAAKQAGADCVKFQTWITEEIIDISAPKADYQKLNDGEDTSQYEMLKRLELSFDEFAELKKYAEPAFYSFLLLMKKAVLIFWQKD